MDITEVKLIHESEFSALVTETYGRPYQLQQQGDCLGQDSLVRVTVPDEPFDIDEEAQWQEWLTRDLDQIPTETQGRLTTQIPELRWKSGLSRELWWTREFYPPLQMVVNDLHQRGLLPAGDYVIHVWW